MNLTDEQIRKIQEEIIKADMPDKECIRKALVEIAVRDETFTVPKVSVLLANPPDFDGKSCLFCRGMRRLLDCQQCYGTQPISENAQRIWEAREHQRQIERGRVSKAQAASPAQAAEFVQRRKKHAGRP